MKERKISFSPPDITEEEIEEVANAMRSGWITTGPRTKELEKQVAAFCNNTNAVCLNSATAALEMSLRVLGIGPGDEVITSAYTYTASASVIDHVGAKIVLVDTQENNLEMDYGALEAAITERTKAVIPVDLAGIPCDYDQIFAIVNRQRDKFFPRNKIQRAIGRIAVIADGAHAFGAEYHGQRIGAVADFTSFSFHAVKNFTTAEGGAALWKTIEGISDEDIYKEYQLLSLHGQNKDALAKTKLSNLPVEVLQHYTGEHTSSGHLYLVRLIGRDADFRNQLIEKMAEHGVATNVHYKPLPMHTAYKAMGFDIKDYPHAYVMYENEVTLPLHTKLTDEDVQYILDVFQEVYQEMTE